VNFGPELEKECDALSYLETAVTSKSADVRRVIVPFAWTIVSRSATRNWVLPARSEMSPADALRTLRRLD
jgi:hypothetical protein